MMDGDPIDRFLSAMPGLPRPVLDRLVDQMIERMDLLDGDPDLEFNGDEHDGSLAEDDFHFRGRSGHGPGCPLSDPGGCEHDGLEDEEGRPPEGATKSREAQLRRIRQDRCVPQYRWERRYGRDNAPQLKPIVMRYRLKRPPLVPSARALLAARNRKPRART